jgi:predicted nucleic acid-binding protein
MIFMDTGAIYSLVVPSEARHEDMQRWHDANKEPLITSDYCLDELLTLLIARKRSSLVLPTGWRIFNEELCDLHFLTPDQVRRAWIVFQSKHPLGWSFTDCTSKVVIDDLEIRTAAALDEHFRQFGAITVVP